MEKILSDLNPSQRAAVTHSGSHALVLAGAGSGKTKTIIARASFLIFNGVKPERILILTFTRRSAYEIVSRVKSHLNQESNGLKSSTFHAWCTALVRKAPNIFGYKDFTIIDRSDQLQLFRYFRGKRTRGTFPSAGEICDLYSYARNTRLSLSNVLIKKEPDLINHKDSIVEIMRLYEDKKRERNYFDYDDILEIVANGMKVNESIRSWVANQYDHILVDEMQDTNPLQWALLEPLLNHVNFFCVGDDAQSIYGFRGADFNNVHSFKERVPNSTILKLEANYRSYQEILDASNWLLQKSPIQYNKKLYAIRGNGSKPVIHNFHNDWQESEWISQDIINRKEKGSKWKNHMILVRTTLSARCLESVFLTKEIPYIFVGGTKLLESAHVRDLLSLLRLIVNHRDEIAWMRYLELWPGIGEVLATKCINDISNATTIEESILILSKKQASINIAIDAVKTVNSSGNSVSEKITKAAQILDGILERKYKNQEWDKRKSDFRLISKIAEKHDSLLDFITDYVLEPISYSEAKESEHNDVVTISTIHSAKGTEREVCYVRNVSTGQYPFLMNGRNAEEIEEDRRLLYVALTRAKDELIITRNILSCLSFDKEGDTESYFFEQVPNEIFIQEIHSLDNKILSFDNKFDNENIKTIDFGIKFE